MASTGGQLQLDTTGWNRLGVGWCKSSAGGTIVVRLLRCNRKQ